MHAAAATKSRSLRIWGSRSFENEAAMTWLEDLDQAEGLEYVEETLDEVLDADASGEAPPNDAAARAIAAAETVATLVSTPADGVPEEVRQWCFDHPGFDLSEVQPKALHALGVIMTESDLRAAFDRSGEGETWESGLEQLRDRLR